MKLLIWDFDGTLGYREGGMWTASLLEVIRQRVPGSAVTADQIRPHLRSGFPWHHPTQPHPELHSADEWWDAFTPVLEKALQAVGFEKSRAQPMARQFRRIYTNPGRWRLFDDAIPTLRKLELLGWTNVVLSNHVPELQGIIRHLGLSHYVAEVFNSAEIGYEKPHPQAFRTVLDAFPGATARWMIGDSLDADITGADAMGIPGILVRKYHADAQYYCDALSQVPAILDPSAAQQLGESTCL